MEVKKPKNPETREKEKMLDYIVTARGSIYRYLPDGTTQRYKKTENKEYTPQNAIVFVPDYETLKRIAPSNMDFEATFGENELQCEQILLAKVQTKGSRNYIINREGKKLDTNQAIQQETGPIFLTFGREDKIELSIPVSREPKIGFHTFDTRKYFNEETNSWERERHLGNKVIEIKYR